MEPELGFKLPSHELAIRAYVWWENSDRRHMPTRDELEGADLDIEHDVFVLHRLMEFRRHLAKGDNF